MRLLRGGRHSARARVRESEREPESDATNARIDVMCFQLCLYMVSEHRQRHTCMCVRSNGVRDADERSLGPAISEIRGLFTVMGSVGVEGAWWGGAVRCALRGAASAPLSRLPRDAETTPPLPLAPSCRCRVFRLAPAGGLGAGPACSASARPWAPAVRARSCEGAPLGWAWGTTC